MGYRGDEQRQVAAMIEQQERDAFEARQADREAQDTPSAPVADDEGRAVLMIEQARVDDARPGDRIFHEPWSVFTVTRVYAAEFACLGLDGFDAHGEVVEAKIRQGTIIRRERPAREPASEQQSADGQEDGRGLAA